MTVTWSATPAQTGGSGEAPRKDVPMANGESPHAGDPHGGGVRAKQAVRSYRDLIVWAKSMELVEEVYRVVRAWPDSERYGLISQATRAAVSIPANISEGYGRRHRKEYVRHLSFARGSLCESETLLIVAVRVEVADRDAVAPMWPRLQEIGRLLNGLIKSLSRPDSLPGAPAQRSQHPTLNPDPRPPAPDPRPL